MYEYKTYGIARFFIEEGYYSIEELEALIKQLKEAKRMQDEALRKSMGVIKNG